MRLRPAALPPVFLAVVLMAPGACGQQAASNADDFEGRQKDVAEAVYDLRDAIAKRDEAKICDAFFTDQLREELLRAAKAAGRGSTCAKAIEDVVQNIDATDIEIVEDGITISGTSATVRFTTDLPKGEDPTDTLALTDERGWRIAKLP